MKTVDLLQHGTIHAFMLLGLTKQEAELAVLGSGQNPANHEAQHNLNAYDDMLSDESNLFRRLREYGGNR